MHQILNHGVSYEIAQREATESKQWLVVYSPDLSASRAWVEASEKLMKHDAANIDEGIQAAKTGDLDTLRRLVQQAWDPHNTVDKFGSTSLMWAAGEGHLDICKYLVDECNVNINALRGKEGLMRHALHWAGRNGKVDVAQWLVFEKHVDVDVGTEDGTTSLHFAAYNGQLAMCAWLIQSCHCDINRLNSYGCNASQWW